MSDTKKRCIAYAVLFVAVIAIVLILTNVISNSGNTADSGALGADSSQNGAAANTGAATENTAAAGVSADTPASGVTSADTSVDTAVSEGNTTTVTGSGNEQSNKDDFYASVSETGSWGENPVFKQLSIVLNNNSELTVDGWILEINVGDKAEIDTSWSGNYSVSGGVLTVTPVDYTTVVSSHGRVELGLIMKNVTGDMNYTLSSANMYSSGVADVSQNNNQNNQNNNQGNNQNNNQNNQNNQNSGSQDRMPAANALEVPEPTTDDWLHVSGKDILDSTGKKVWITGVNWFGYNTGTNLFDGLWNSDLNTSIQSIADHGFNLIRVPISAELILQWKQGQAPTANFNQATNYYLVGMNSLEIWDYVLGQFRACGLKVMIDIHSAETNASGHNINLWKTSKISTEQYQEALVWMADRYKNDDVIVAYDLKNEPHGKPFEGKEAAIWNDSTADNNWKYVAEQTALKVLAVNPNVLIMVEGTEIYPIDIKSNGDFHSTDEKDYYFNWWGGNLRGVADYPINLGKYQDKLVYSPHDYGPTVYEQPWFKNSYNYDSLMKDCWKDNWFYIYENKTAPLLIGEWGGFMREPNLTWMTYMRELIGKYNLNHTFWCFNANSGDTGGLVLDDFTTWDTEKYNFVKEVLWQENGKFIGLDHQIPLGPSGNGITLTGAKGL